MVRVGYASSFYSLREWRRRAAREVRSPLEGDGAGHLRRRERSHAAHLREALPRHAAQAAARAGARLAEQRALVQGVVLLGHIHAQDAVRQHGTLPARPRGARRFRRARARGAPSPGLCARRAKARPVLRAPTALVVVGQLHALGHGRQEPPCTRLPISHFGLASRVPHPLAPPYISLGIFQCILKCYPSLLLRSPPTNS